MTTSAPQWPGQDGPQQQDSAEQQDGAHREEARRPASPVRTASPGDAPPPSAPPRSALPRPARAPEPGTARRPLQPVPGPPAAPEGRSRLQRQQEQRAAARRRFVVVRDPAEQDLRAARRRARANLPSPGAVTREIALALLEVEAGCRSVTQLERVVSRELWEVLEPRIGRQGGPLPSGRSVISVRCQEHVPGLADTVAVVRRGELVRPVALRLDASDGRWVVTELRWWRNETDTATTRGRDGGSSR